MDAGERAHRDRPNSEELRHFVDGVEAEALDRAAARLADARPSLPDESRGRLRAELATLLGVEPDEGKKYLARGLRGVAAALEPRAAAPSPPGDQ